MNETNRGGSKDPECASSPQSTGPMSQAQKFDAGDERGIARTRKPPFHGTEFAGDFGAALSWLRAGYAVQRAGWNGPNQSLKLQVPDEYSKMTLPYIYITTVQGYLVPWLASQTDLLASDWRVATKVVPL